MSVVPGAIVLLNVRDQVLRLVLPKIGTLAFRFAICNDASSSLTDIAIGSELSTVLGVLVPGKG